MTVLASLEQQPQQDRHLTVEVGDIAQITRLVMRKLDVTQPDGSTRKEDVPVVQSLQGVVMFTPQSIRRPEILKNPITDRETRIGVLPVYHIAQVTLVAEDKRPMELRSPDLILSPRSQVFEIEPVSQIDNQLPLF